MSNTIKAKDDRMYRKYLASRSWECQGGGSHFWVPGEGLQWRCTKCPATRTFPIPSGNWQAEWDIEGASR